MRRAAQILLDFLKKKKLMIAFAESMSCGLLTHQLNTIKGTSEVLKGAVICYHEHVKTALLKVDKELIKKHTAESQKVTDELAKNLQDLIDADIHAAVTGLATTGGSESKTKPVGTVFYSFVFKGKLYRMRKYFKGTPLRIKKKTCEEFYKFIYKSLAKKK
jgi:nicotinamide-nucleotide amidase